MTVERKKISEATELGANTGGTKRRNDVSSKQANKLLRMYPQPPYEVKITHGEFYNVYDTHVSGSD